MNDNIQEIIYNLNNIHCIDFNTLHFSLNNIKNILSNQKKYYQNVIVIATFNRIDMIEETFNSLFKSNLENTLLIIVDDVSDNKTQEYIKQYNIPIPNIKIFKKKNTKMYKSFIIGFDLALNLFDSKFFIILDSDTIHNKNWLIKLIELYNNLNTENILLTGFNTQTHPIIKSYNNYHEKITIGGVNMFFNNTFYKNHVKNILNKSNGTWDWELVRYCKSKKIKICCTKPSVIQHIGDIGLHSNKNKYDIAIDYNPNF